MSFAAHGNWCGPGWSARQWKDAKDLTEEDKLVPAVDELDQACKNHDIAIAEGDPNANPNFYEEAMAAGWFGTAAAAAVAIGGPPSHSYLRGSKKMKEKKKLTYKELKERKNVKMRDINAKKIKAEAIQKAEEDDAEMVNPLKRKPSSELDDQRDHPGNADVIDVTSSTDEEEKEDPALREMMDAVEENERVLATLDAQGDLVTPQRPTRPRVPNVTRGEGRPIRGMRPNGGSLTNLLSERDNTMEDVSMEPMALRSADASASGNPAKQKSVAVRYDSRQEMGFLTETRTAMLPVSIYFSINKLDSDTPVKFQFILNDTYDIFRYVNIVPQTFPSTSASYSGNQVSGATITGNITGILGATESLQRDAAVPPKLNAVVDHDPRNIDCTVTLSDPTRDLTKASYPAVARSKGISSDMAYSVYAPSAHGMKLLKPVGVNAGRAVRFPVTMRSVTAATATVTTSGTPGFDSAPGGEKENGDYAMAWRNWYERMYRSRHVMKTEWQLTMENAQEGAYHRGVVLEAIDTITSDTQSPNYVTPTDKALGEMLRFKRIKENRLASFNAQGGKPVNIISGQWSPNSNRRRDVVDEELITTWYPTRARNGPSNKAWEEIQTLLFYNDQMSNNQNGYFNCKLDLLYHVQYRDLFGEYRYPSWNDQSPILTVRDMCFPSTHPSVWPTADDPSLTEAINISDSWNNAHV